MEQRKFQVFVSSTYTDLRDTRRQVIEAIQRMLQFPVGMELFSADDDDQWQVIKDTIDQSDYYVCLIGHRYGSINKKIGISFTEMEWDYAKSKGIPVMSFIRERSVATTPTEREAATDSQEKLEQFIAKARSDKMVDEWSAPADLISKVVTALFKAFQGKPRPGWIRADSNVVAEQLARVIEENRSLRLNVEQLKSTVDRTAPKFQVVLNSTRNLEFNFAPDDRIKLSPDAMVRKLSADDVPNELKQMVTASMLESYNKQLPTAEDVKRHNDWKKWYERASQTRNSIVIAVQNTGSAKAREVYVDITFPKELWALKMSEYEEWKAPALYLPKNPIEDAREKLRVATSKNPFLDLMSSLGGITQTSYVAPNAASRTALQEIGLNYSLTVSHQERKVSVWIKDIMHTRQQLVHGLIVVPLSRGKGKIDVVMICEELAEPMKQSIAVKVV